MQQQGFEDDIDGPCEPIAIREEDLVTDINTERDTTKQEKAYGDSDGSKTGTDDDSIFWDGMMPLIVTHTKFMHEVYHHV